MAADGPCVRARRRAPAAPHAQRWQERVVMHALTAIKGPSGPRAFAEPTHDRVIACSGSPAATSQGCFAALPPTNHHRRRYPASSDRYFPDSKPAAPPAARPPRPPAAPQQ